jgi:hypothetical protein
MLTVRRLPLLILLALLLVPAKALASNSMEFALQDDDVFIYQSGLDRSEGLDHAEDLGVQRIRVNVLWSRVLVPGSTSDKPVYDFSAIDSLQSEAALRGIQLQLTIAGPAPAWATANHRVGPDRPDPVKYGKFVRAVAEHFKGRVNRYSIWNEPNWTGWLAPQSKSPGLYRKLYTAGYAAVKAVDPSAQVLIGELAPIAEGRRAMAPLAFLRQMFPRGSKPLKADGFALHPYQLTSAPTAVPKGRPDDVTIGTLPRLTKALDKLYKSRRLRTTKGKKLNLYLTEFGYLTKGSRAQPPKRVAQWLKAAIGLARKNPRVKELLQYQLVDPASSALWHSALLNRHGDPRPAYAAIAHAFNP